MGNPFFSNPTLKDFEPRFGFAWDPLRNGKTAVRGGIGLFDVHPLPYQFPLLVSQAIPFFSYTVVKDPAGACSAPLSPCPNPFPNFGGQDITFPVNRLHTTYAEPQPKRNYILQWNLNVQQQLTPSLAAMAAYVGSRGIHQPYRVDDANLVIPTLTSSGYVWPFDSSGGPLDPINPNFGSVRGMFYRGHSYYNAMELQLAKRMSHGFQVQGTYTSSKSMDTSSASVAGDTFGNSISSLDWFDMRLTRGPSDFNVGRTLVVNGTWQVPTPKSLTGPAQWALGGWELGLIFTASDGVPFSPTWGTGSDARNFQPQPGKQITRLSKARLDACSGQIMHFEPGWDSKHDDRWRQYRNPLVVRCRAGSCRAFPTPYRAAASAFPFSALRDRFP